MNRFQFWRVVRLAELQREGRRARLMFAAMMGDHGGVWLLTC